MRYRIWRHIPEDARRAAATAEYAMLLPGLGPDAPVVRRTVEGRCPLGVALAAMGLPPVGCTRAWSDPDAPIVAEALGLPNDRAAAAFINAWDLGRIGPSDLRSLLEVGS
jgi:hypothetical protein